MDGRGFPYGPWLFCGSVEMELKRGREGIVLEDLSPLD
jgi:hypothetical protein